MQLCELYVATKVVAGGLSSFSLLHFKGQTQWYFWFSWHLTIFTFFLGLLLVNIYSYFALLSYPREEVQT